ncbi:MAG: aa3-type cytochrome oxidase subunit CtaJ [Mycobacteriaceae bacterium]
MSILETVLIFVVIPAAVVAIFGLLAIVSKHNRVAEYRLTEKWTHQPILWAAVDESLGSGHGSAAHGDNNHDSHSGHVDNSELVGGSAHGKW